MRGLRTWLHVTGLEGTLPFSSFTEEINKERSPQCRFPVGVVVVVVAVQVEPSLVGKVVRAQGYELQPLRLDMLACVKPAM